MVIIIKKNGEIHMQIDVIERNSHKRFQILLFSELSW